MKSVVIFQYRLLHYRTKLFEQLRAACADRGINLHLVHGQASRRELAKKDEGSLSWAHKVLNKFWEVSGRDIVWQPYPSALKKADLVVVMQENRILSNYPLLLSRIWSRRKLAYWGHGKNFQSDRPTGLREKWKDYLLSRVDWWFAYTETTVDILKQANYPSTQITCLDNAIDNDGFVQDLASISELRIQELRQQIGANDQSRISLFCGSLYADKRLAFMIAAADQIHAVCPEFCLVVIGDGPSAAEVQLAAASRPWMHSVGVRKGAEKAAYFRIADVVFNPGAVGLHVLDAFCAGIPMATTLEARHGPEFAYLIDGQNGVCTSGSADNYARAIVALFSDPEAYGRLCLGAKASAQRYTLTNMVNRFADGIENALHS
ncbi:glycosyltransferase family 4 protein [Undibacterium sp.]|uniref:glycosyltransferase family 4 protein n=1 Tax=Undibacterium sp. TaxID=1914977 RepID=UPI0025F417A1|nr:glycosyltransferase family 4 protein [Undibacterium sp.]